MKEASVSPWDIWAVTTTNASGALRHVTRNCTLFEVRKTGVLCLSVLFFPVTQCLTLRNYFRGFVCYCYMSSLKSTTSTKLHICSACTYENCLYWKNVVLYLPTSNLHLQQMHQLHAFHCYPYLFLLELSQATETAG